MHKYLILLFLAFSTFIIQGHSQTPSMKWSAGPEIQVYPTGWMPGVRIQKGIDAYSFVSFRIAANIFDHRDLGVQEKEKGNGLGFSLGYHRNIIKNNDHLILGIKSDFWWNSNDWENSPGSGKPISGTSDIVVIQPTAELGYLIGSKENKFNLIPSIAFGFEINVETKGEPVGEGLILLLGLQGLFSF